MKLALLVGLVTAATAREQVNFDFAWRHRLGNASWWAPGPNGAPPESQPAFDDSEWALVDAPHDMLVMQNYTQAASNKMAYILRNVGWYRKHFTIPDAWTGSAVYLYIEGSFHETSTWLNGIQIGFHKQGYTSWWLRLDTAHGVRFGAENVLALYVDASTGTGWWYEGGGLSRHNFLLQTSQVHMPPSAAWVSTSSGPSGGATFTANATVVGPTTGGSAVRGSYKLKATIVDAGGTAVGTATGSAFTPSANGAEITVDVKVSSAKRWSVQAPHLYTAALELLDAAGTVVDSSNITTGIRTIRWDANNGLFVNDQKVKLRGFCDHSSFAGVGAAVPDRINLFRAQALRAVGGNSWRMAHNPPVPARLDLMDRLGMLALDENRDYGGQHGQGGNTPESVADELVDMADLVRRDRSHPSVMAWSFCNEVGCNNESAAAAFRAISKLWDPTRAVTQNRYGTDLSTAYLDIQGFSHRKAKDFESFHKSHPEKPLMASECCSCMSQRGVDEDVCPKPKDGGCVDPPKPLPAGVFYNNNIGQCTLEQVNASDSPDYVTGTFVWSGFDYMGEARGWPQNTKCRGTVADVAGFTKETAYWIKSWWLSAIPKSDAGRPLDTYGDAEWTVFVVESWLPPPAGTHRTINVYSNAPSVRLELNGKAVGTASISHLSMATFSVEYAPGNLTAYGLDSKGSVVGSHSITSTGAVAAVVLSIDAPSVTSGTGSFVVADGEDVAMLRATLVDSNGLMVPGADNHVVFSVVSGPGKVWATHNGDPANTVPGWYGAVHGNPAYHGLSRAIIRTTADHATPAWHRQRLLEIDSDRTVDIVAPGSERQLNAIVVQAEVEGLETAQISIPVSADPMHLPINVAGRHALQPRGTFVV